MDWNQSTMYEQRVRFILEVQQRTFSFAESRRRYGISRTAGYVWWTRFLTEGFERLHDRSHRPHHCPHAVAEPIVEHVVNLRQRYGWGSRKIRKLTAVKLGSAPARRTIDRIFERHDLITKKRRRSGKPSHPGKPLTPMDEPNAVWTVDFKGQFKMHNGRYCYPLTIQDGFSRFLLECRGLYSTSIELAKPVFIKTFREFGLPAVIRSDNGTPFASIGLTRGPPPIQWTDKCLSFSSVLHPRWSQKLPLRQRRRGVEGSRDPPRLEAPRQPEGPKGSRCLRVLHFEVDRRLVAQR